MSESNALPIVLLSEQFARLPGIGMKTAQRLAYFVTSMPEEDVSAFAEALINAKKKILSFVLYVRILPTEKYVLYAAIQNATKILSVW